MVGDQTPERQPKLGRATISIPDFELPLNGGCKSFRSCACECRLPDGRVLKLWVEGVFHAHASAN